MKFTFKLKINRESAIQMAISEPVMQSLCRGEERPVAAAIAEAGVAAVAPAETAA